MRSLLILPLLVLLAACQTVTRPLGFSSQQVAVLQQEGFKPVGENFELGIEDRLLFEVDKSDLQPEASAVIERLARTLIGIGIGGSLIEGHTDSTGTSEYNQALSLRRAETVRAAMVAAGMPVAAVRVMGLGETDPVDTNDTPEGRQQNRRVVVIVAPLDIVKP